MTLMPIIPSSKATAYRLDNATADGVTLDLTSGTSLTSTSSFRWRPDGTRFFAVESGSYIYYWDCSTAWDLSTASYITRIRLNQVDGSTPEVDQPYDSLDFNGDGSEVTAHQSGTLRTWSLTGAYSGNTARIATETGIAGNSFEFNSDGTKLHYLNSGQIRSRALSTPYDISTIGSEVDEADLSTASSIDPARSGTRVLAVESNVVKEYATATAEDFSSLTLNASFDPSMSVEFGAYAGNGSKLYLLNSETITQYSTVG